MRRVFFHGQGGFSVIISIPEPFFLKLMTLPSKGEVGLAEGVGGGLVFSGIPLRHSAFEREFFVFNET